MEWKDRVSSLVSQLSGWFWVIPSSSKSSCCLRWDSCSCVTFQERVLGSCPGLLSLIPSTEGTRLKPPTLPAFEFIKLKAECWGNDPWQPSYVVMPPLNNQIMYKTNIAFYASYWTEHMKRRNYPAVARSSCGMKRQGFITCTTSFSSYASSLDKFGEGLTSPLEVVYFITSL